MLRRMALEPRKPPLVALGLALLAPALLQSLISYPLDADTAYHHAVALLTLRHGWLTSFPWTPFSWLWDHYADKEPLFHVLQLVLSPLGFEATSAVVGVLLGGALLATIAVLLWREEVRRPELLIGLALAGSVAFVWRLTLVRPHLLSIPLALLVTWATARDRRRWLFGAAMLWPLCYVGWPSGFALIGAGLAGRWLAGERTWRVAGATAGVGVAGLGLGALVHPNGPNHLAFGWLVFRDVLLDAAWKGSALVPLGREFEPFSGRALLIHGLPAAAIALLGIVLGLRARKVSAAAGAFALATLLYALLTARTARFVEYLVPFAVTAVGLALAARKEEARATRPLVALLLLGAVGWATFGRATLERMGNRPIDVPEADARAMRAAIPEQSQLFTCGWGLTGALLLALPERKLLVALDPTLMARRDRALYEAWFRLVRAPPAAPSGEIARTFGARFAVCEHDVEHAPLVRALDADPHATLRVRTDQWSVWELAPAAPELAN